MKIERLPEYATIAITILCGMLLALYIGVSAGTGSRTPIMLLAGFIAVAVALTLKDKIWLLIPIGGSFTAPIAGTSFNGGHITIVYAFVVYLTLRALKIVRSKASYDWLDYCLFANLLYLLITYLRNPVGANFFGVEKIGGRPYIDVIFALLAYYVLGQVKVSSKLAIRLPFLMILGSIFGSIAGAVGVFFPSAGMSLSRVYGAFTPTQADVGPADSGTVQREGFMVAGGTNILQALCSYFPPLSLLNPIHFFRFAFALLALIGILKSGFRSALFGCFMFGLVAIYFRRGFPALIRAAALGIPVLAVLVLGQGNFFELPLNMQRTLSFLPGNWNWEAVQSARESTEWRYEIWDNVRHSGNKYINNWWLGDGFGMTRSQLRENMSSIQEIQENLTISGDYHSLPLTTIHVVGYVGLVLLVVQLIAQAYYAWKLLKRAKGSPFFIWALFSAGPSIYLPITSMLLFGAFNVVAPMNVMIVAWMRLLSRSMDAYLEENKPSFTKKSEPLPDLETRPQFEHALLKKPL